METENEPIKIGRIARPIERALNISLTGEVSIYMSSSDLDAIAQKRPNSYLKYLEELGAILKNPDFVSFCADHEEMAFVKAYFQDGGFSFVKLTIQRLGAPARWFYKCLTPLSKASGPEQWPYPFVRPCNKKDSPMG